MKPTSETDQIADIFVIGGGINGTGIARDAAGRGLSVVLAEKDDLAQATSSASTKLFHGGLRYLEFFEIGLVRKALQEREVLLRAMPHISWPMRFVLPYHKDMRFEGTTPAAKLLSTFMPWMKGRRPAWMIRLGLFLYDNLGGRQILPGTKTLDLREGPEGAPLKDKFARAYEYSDCWVQDARLVVLNARDAAARGARILTRTEVTGTDRTGDHWRVHVTHADGTRSSIRARILVNAAGPWVGDVITQVVRSNSTETVRLVRGSHIVTRKLFDHDKCYFFQGEDGRIIFAIPYEHDFTLIGTTDQDHDDPDQPPVCTDAETDYLCAFASEYFKRPVTRDDVVWTYSGVRPLYDDGAKSATAATREYVLSLDTAGAPLLNVFGGKITTYRKLAEATMDKLAPHIPGLMAHWTAGVPLPGGDFAPDGVADLAASLRARYGFLDDAWTARLIRTYGAETFDVYGDATSASDLGQDFGATVTARELDWAVANEWVVTADDYLWRRTKRGLRVTREQAQAITGYLAKNTTV